MKALYAHVAHDLRLEPCAAPGPGEVAVKIARGRICGSELHYFNHGGFGTVRLREPMIVGHEVAGEVISLGENVTGLPIGDLVAVSPSRPCGDCGECPPGLPNHCLNMQFYGSSMPFPLIQGAFRGVLVADAHQCAPAHGLSPSEAAMAKPLAVCLHVVRKAGELLGRLILVIGCGPIGVLVILAARRAGAAEIIDTDIADAALRFAEAAGTDLVFNTQRDPRDLSQFQKGKGSLEVPFQCSGAQAALAAGIAALCPRGVLVQLGLSGDMTLPMLQITAKELLLRGSFRFHEKFAIAIDMMRKGLIDVNDLTTHSFPVADFQTAFATAFATASDRIQAMKVQLEFT